MTKEQEKVLAGLHVVGEPSEHCINYQYKDLPMYITKCGNTYYYSTTLGNNFGLHPDTVEYWDLTEADIAQIIIDKLVGEKNIETAQDKLGINKDELNKMVDELAVELGLDIDKVGEA